MKKYFDQKPLGQEILKVCKKKSKVNKCRLKFARIIAPRAWMGLQL